MTLPGPLRIAALLLAWFASVGAACAEAEFLLVGTVVNGTESDGLGVLREGEIWFLPIEDFAELMGAELVLAESQATLMTSLGEVVLEPSELPMLDGRPHVSSLTLNERLAVTLRFDETQYALYLDLPWRGGTPGQGPAAEEAEPEARAPGSALSSLRVDSRFAWDGGSLQGFATTTMDGRLAGGRWRLRHRQSFDGDFALEDYAWLRTRGRHLFLAGRQRVDLHPVLPSLEFTGLQHAWTNQPMELLQASPDSGELLPRRLQPVSTLRGSGPPGGFAELWIDGTRAERVPIGFAAEYEFFDVPISPRRLNEIEVRVFDRRQPRVPVAIHDHSTRGYEYLLPRGARVLTSGLGVGGNLLDQLLGNEGSQGVAAFVQARFGLTANWTLEAAAQHGDAGSTLMTAFAGRLPGEVLMSAGVAMSDQGLSTQLSLDKEWRRWRLLARSRTEPGGPADKGIEASQDHLVELSWRRPGRFDLALIARDRSAGEERWTFLLPSVAWRPRDDLSLKVRPDAEGSMRFDVEYRPKPWMRLAASHQDRFFLDANFQVNEAFQVTARSQVGGEQDASHAAGLRWSSGGGRGLEMGAEVETAGGGAGYRLDGKARLAPGLLGTWILQDTPGGGGSGPRVEVGLSLDLAMAGGKLVPALAANARNGKGGVAGRVVALSQVDPAALQGLTITVDGDGRATTEAGGRFHLQNLQPGLHVIALDTADLPIELVPVKRAVLAEIASGAVTRVDFEVRAEYGIAGRITDADDRRLAGVALELRDESGERAATAVTDRFGLYRMDGLSPGRYTLAVQARDRHAAGAPEGVVVLSDDFLFGQDLVLPAQPRTEGPPLAQLAATPAGI